MENMHIKRCSISCIIKTAMRYLYTLIRMAKIQILTTPNAGEDVEQQDLSFIAGGNVKWYDHARKQFGSFYKTKHTLTT